jgi:hypothetical protein
MLQAFKVFMKLQVIQSWKTLSLFGQNCFPIYNFEINYKGSVCN